MDGREAMLRICAEVDSMLPEFVATMDARFGVQAGTSRCVLPAGAWTGTLYVMACRRLGRKPIEAGRG